MDVTAQILTDIKEGEWVLVTAEKQTNSQGPKGKSWFSPHGLNIYMSLILAVDSNLCSNHMFDLNFEEIVSLSIAQSISNITSNKCIPQIKWVNDVLINNKKVSGSYCIRHNLNESMSVLEAGIGLNVNMESKFFSHVDQSITSLKHECHLNFDRNILLETLLKHLSKNLNKFFNGGFLPFHQDINKKLAFKGKILTFNLNVNKDSFITPEHYRHTSLPPKLIKAEVIGLDTSGKLIIKQPTQSQRILVDARAGIIKTASPILG